MHILSLNESIFFTSNIIFIQIFVQVSLKDNTLKYFICIEIN